MKVKLTIGDWSEDGHNQYDQFVFEVNKDVSEIRQAYKDSCKLTGYQFNHNQDFTGLNLKWPESESRQICTEYEEYSISDEASEKLLEFGIDVISDDSDFVDYTDPETFANLIMEFIKLSLPDLTWEEASYKNSELRDMAPINGWWNKELNVQFGYGLYD